MAEVRAAQVEDVSAIAAIDPQSLGGAGKIRNLVQGQASLVAVERGQIVGFLVLKPGHFYQRDFIDLLFVAPRWRRQGIGRALLRAGIRNASTSRVFVSTNESNTPMRELLSSRWVLAASGSRETGGRGSCGWSRADVAGDRCAARAPAGAVTGSRVADAGRAV
jgi:ribosomal protein S18 acetylase RimI-like enzyme